MNTTLISILAGLGGMFGWGTSDFFANNASEKIGHFKTFFWSQVAGIMLVAVAALFFAEKFWYSSWQLFVLTLLSGIVYAIGYLLFYRGFQIGNVSVVSAVINGQVLFIMAIAYFLFGQRLTFLQIPAMIAVIIGLTLVSVNFKDLFKGSVSLLAGVKETLLAAIMFGVLYWPANEYIVEREDWLVVILVTKLTSLATVFAIAQFQKNSLKVEAKASKQNFLVALVGILEALAVLSVSFGLKLGDAIIVSPVSSALTIVTVGLAMVFLKERITKLQALGIALTIGGIVATAL